VKTDGEKSVKRLWSVKGGQEREREREKKRASESERERGVEREWYG
jgi:hypothetical protein